MPETVIESLKVETTVPAKVEEVRIEYPKHFFVYVDSGKVVVPNSKGDAVATISKAALTTFLNSIVWGTGKVSIVEKTVTETEITPK